MKSAAFRTVAWFAIVVLSHFGFLTQARAREFCVEGTMSLRTIVHTGETVVEQDHHFSASVRDCNWYVKKVPINLMVQGTNVPGHDYSTASSDGTNFYHLVCFETIQKTKGSKNTFAGAIGPGSVPFGITDITMIILWYTFASSCYFDALQDSFVNPPTKFRDASAYAKDFRVKASWELASLPPFLPKRVAFGSVPRFQFELAASNDPLVRDFTNCLLTVQDTVRISGLEFPKAVDVQFFVKNPTNLSDIFRDTTIRIHVTNILETAAVTNFGGAMRGVSAVSDLRTISAATPFAVASGLVKAWPSLETSQAKARARLRGPRKSSVPIVVVQGMILTLALFPAAYAVRHMWKTKTKHQKERSL